MEFVVKGVMDPVCVKRGIMTDRNDRMTSCGVYETGCMKLEVLNRAAYEKSINEPKRLKS